MLVYNTFKKLVYKALKHEILNAIFKKFLAALKLCESNLLISATSNLIPHVNKQHEPRHEKHVHFETRLES